MEKYPPNNVFDKSFGFNYLYSNSDIIWNDDFSSKLFEFTKALNSEELIFEILNPEEYNHLFEKKIVINNITTQQIINVYDINSKIDIELYPLLTFSFYIYDNTDRWRIYASDSYEIGIFACDKKVNSLYEVIFKPYAEESLKQKNSLVSSRLFEEYKKEYINELEENYKFSNYIS
jgi:hypothetical protein